MNFTPNGECGTFVPFNAFVRTDDTARFGRDPLALDAAGTPVGLQTIAVRPDRAGNPGGRQAYCNQYGESLVDGWGRRRGGMAVRHRHPARAAAAPVRRVHLSPPELHQHLVSATSCGIGCDRFNGAQDVRGVSGRMPRLHEPVVRLLHGDGSDRSAAARRRRLPDPRPERHEEDACPLGHRRSRPSWTSGSTRGMASTRTSTGAAPQGIFAQVGTSTGRTQRETCYAAARRAERSRPRRRRVPRQDAAR